METEPWLDEILNDPDWALWVPNEWDDDEPEDLDEEE